MRNYHKQAILAHDLAESVHIRQADKCGEPYMEHVMRVARAAMKHAPVSLRRDTTEQLGSKLYIVGLLHDTVEDVEDRPRERVAEQILFTQGNEIFKAVEALTHMAWKSEPYKEYIERVKDNLLATEVKLEDLKDNFNPERALRLATFNPKDFTRVVDVLIPRYIRAYDYLTH